MIFIVPILVVWSFLFLIEKDSFELYKTLASTQNFLKLIPSSQSSLPESSGIASEANSLNTWENLFAPWNLFSYVMPTAGKVKTENIGGEKKT